MKKLLKNCFYGLAIGSIINTVCGLLFTTGTLQLTMLLFFFFSIICGATGSLYTTNKMSLLAKTCMQILIIYGAFLVCAYVGGWFPFYIRIILSATVMFFIIFFAIWTAMYFIEKNELKKINRQISK